MRFKLLFIFLCSILFSQGVKEEYRTILLASIETDVPDYLIVGLIYAESRNNPKCVSAYRADGSRDEGIVQLNSKYLDYFKWKFNKNQKIDPFNPESAIPVCARILAYNYKIFGNWIEALAAYRQGVQGVKKNGIDSKSYKYIDSVFSYGILFERSK